MVNINASVTNSISASTPWSPKGVMQSLNPVFAAQHSKNQCTRNNSYFYSLINLQQRGWFALLQLFSLNVCFALKISCKGIPTGTYLFTPLAQAGERTVWIIWLVQYNNFGFIYLERRKYFYLFHLVFNYCIQVVTIIKSR